MQEKKTLKIILLHLLLDQVFVCNELWVATFHTAFAGLFQLLQELFEDSLTMGLEN